MLFVGRSLIQTLAPIALSFAAPGCSTDTGATDAGGTQGASSTGAASSSDDAGSTGTAGADSTAADDWSTGTTGASPPDPLAWTSECVIGSSDLSRLHPRIECTSIDVPLDWSDPESEIVAVAAFRVPTEAARRRGTFWLLEGGPGSSGLVFFTDTEQMARLGDAGWDVVVPSHRGTLAPLLTCDGVAESVACREELEDTWGADLQHFNTVQAAHDLAELLARATVADDGSAIVYGVSYGTLWAQYLLGLYPTAADAVILDSVLPAHPNVAQQEALVDARAAALLQVCIDDPTCGARVPYASGEAFVAAVIDAFNNDDCGPTDFGSWASSELSTHLGAVLNRKTARNYLPVLAALLARCTAADTALARGAAASLEGLAAAQPRANGVADRVQAAHALAERYGVSPDLFFSRALFPVVVATTMVPDGVEIEVGADVLVAIGIPALIEQSIAVYDDLPDVAFDNDFTPEVPVLVVNARYDLQTPLPWAERIATQYGVDVVEVADGEHALFLSGNGGRDLDGARCIQPLILGFAAGPSEPVDDTCVTALPSIDVNLTRPDLAAVSQAAFGTTDPWSLLE